MQSCHCAGSSGCRRAATSSRITHLVLWLPSTHRTSCSPESPPRPHPDPSQRSLGAQIESGFNSNALASLSRSGSTHCDYSCNLHTHSQQIWRQISRDFAGALWFQVAWFSAVSSRCDSYVAILGIYVGLVWGTYRATKTENYRTIGRDHNSHPANFTKSPLIPSGQNFALGPISPSPSLLHSKTVQLRTTTADNMQGVPTVGCGWPQNNGSCIFFIQWQEETRSPEYSCSNNPGKPIFQHFNAVTAPNHWISGIMMQ